MDLSKEFIVTPTVATLRDFLSRPGARHAFLIGAPGTGKTAALQYLASSLRADNCLVVTVQLRDIDTSDQLVVQIARAFLDQTQAQDKPLEFDPLDQIRAQFANQFTSSQSLSRAAEVLERIIQLVIERTGMKSRAYIFLDGLDEAYRAGDIVVAVESLAERLRSTSLVVASRESSVVNRLGSRTAFDTFVLAPMTQAEAVQFIRRLLPDASLTGPAFEQLVEQLVLRAEGSPLLLNLLASNFRKFGDLATSEKPGTIRTFIDRLYYELLGSDQTGVDALRLLSLLVFLQPVSTDYLIEISGLPVVRAQAALAQTVSYQRICGGLFQLLPVPVESLAANASASRFNSCTVVPCDMSATR